MIKEYPAWSLNRIKLVGNRLFVLINEKVDVLTGSAYSWTSVALHDSGEYCSIAPGHDGVFTSTVRKQGIMELSLDGTMAQQFAPFQGGNDALEPGPTSMAASCSTLYALSIDHALWGIDLKTKAQTALVTGLEGDLWGVAVDEKFVYVNRANAGGVTRISRSTLAVDKFGDGSNVFTMAVDAQYVYFDDHSTGAIKRIIK